MNYMANPTCCIKQRMDGSGKCTEPATVTREVYGRTKHYCEQCNKDVLYIQARIEQLKGKVGLQAYDFNDL